MIYSYLNLDAISFVLFPQASQPSMNFIISKMVYLLNHQPITWSTFSTSIWSNPVLFHTYCEFGCLFTHSWIRFLPSSLSPEKECSGSVSLLGINSLLPPAKITSMPSPYGYSRSCKAVTEKGKGGHSEIHAVFLKSCIAVSWKSEGCNVQQAPTD